MRRLGTVVVLLAAFASGWVFPPGAAAFDRKVTFAPVVGARLFEEDLDLETDISFGARIGMELSPRWGMLFDFVASHPVRTSSGREVVIDCMRVLAKVNLVTGETRPYVVAGIGGGMFLFPDTPNTAEGMLTVGLGLERQVGSKLAVFVESSADMFRSETVLYTPSGGEYLVEPRETHTLGTACIGLTVEF